MEIDLLRAFCELALRKHYGAASEHLYITQSALTKKIQRLEHMIGAKLFDRGRGGASLTPLGAVLLPEARRLVDNFDTFSKLTKKAVAGKTGFLKIGFGISSYDVATDIIAEFTNANPEIHISLDDIPSQLQREMLLSGELDISFSRLAIAGELESKVVTNDELVLAVHHSVELDNDPFKNLTDTSYMRLNPARGLGYSNLVDRYLNETNRQLAVEREANDILTLYTMISANLGYSIVPKSTQYLGSEKVRYIPLDDLNTHWQVGMIWNPEIENPVRDYFVQLVCS
ncbi:LysR family transcriptional regulator [Vibrio sp. SCSIO 43137]|uniref:LysR family transcriptional regulator n=1 Tax=Vibrio sp. SCSIO 43137 TaxID=3021011 RepID=UPI0023075C28|nr:LysR family transcriptional regulator [Vibrio sp. SCSIO 43137]WCE32247.1 LysR family transcriptional regulator [Vibrio sp. SCSIO 43137]